MSFKSIIVASTAVLLSMVVFADESRGEAPLFPQQRVQVSSTVNLVAQGVTTEAVRNEFSASGDLFIDVPVGPLSLHVYLEASSTPRAGGVFDRVPAGNTDAGTALGPDGRGRIQLSEMRLGWELGEGSALHLGLMDLTGFLDVSRIANDENLFFLAAPFVNNPTIGFPDYVLGASVEAASPWSSKARLALSVSSSHGLADNPGRSYRELFELSGPEKGAFVAARVRWVGERWRGALGGWSDSSTRGVTGPAEEGGASRGIFTVLGWARGTHALNLRLGGANRSATGFTSFAGLNYLGEWHRNALGVGIAASGTPPEAAGEAVHQAEAFLRHRLFAGAYLTASLQWLSNSAVVAMERPAGHGVFITGARLSVTF